MLLPLWLILPLLASSVSGNVEKTIFTAPPASKTGPELSDLLKTWSVLGTLSPETNLSIRIPIQAEFPSETAPRGKKSWFYLDSLHPGQRYEVRVCWLATQPTSFWLSTYSISQILDSLPGVATSSAKIASEINAGSELQQRDPSSSLFLLLEAAADYFTFNQTLMETVPPVYADVILDPYLLNVLPQSLVPTIAYILVVAIVAWCVSGLVLSMIKGQVPRTKISVDKKTR